MSEVLRGTIRAFAAGDHTATVEVDGSPGVYLAGVPVSRGIADAQVVAGRWCVLAWTGRYGNPSEAMVVGVY